MGNFVREARNAVKIEGFRLSRVPINPSDAIFQGDMMAWDVVNRRAVVITVSGAPSGTTFLGVADHTNPVATIGMLTSAFQDTRMNIIQQGLVEMIAEATETYFPFDTLIVGSSPQHVKKGSTNSVGFADTRYTAAGVAVTSGDYVYMWLKVADAYRAFF